MRQADASEEEKDSIKSLAGWLIVDRKELANFHGFNVSHESAPFTAHLRRLHRIERTDRTNEPTKSQSRGEERREEMVIIM